MKVSELEGAALDYWVARANGMNPETADVVRQVACYSTNWAAAGPIIEGERIMLAHGELNSGSAWVAHYGVGSGVPHRGIGKTLLSAAMRVFVLSKYGDEVPDAFIGTPGSRLDVVSTDS